MDYGHLKNRQFSKAKAALALLISVSPLFDCARAVALTLETPLETRTTNSPVFTAPLPMQALVPLQTETQRFELPSWSIPPQAIPTATQTQDQTVMVRLNQTAAPTEVTRQGAQASAAAVKNDADVRFDAMTPTQSATTVTGSESSSIIRHVADDQSRFSLEKPSLKMSVPALKSKASEKRSWRPSVKHLAVLGGIAVLGVAAHLTGQHSLLAGAVPLLAGLVVPQGASDEQKLLAALKDQFKAGDALSIQDAVALGSLVGLSEEQTKTAWQRLAYDGHVAILNNGSSVHFDVPDAPAGSPPALQQGVEGVRAALRALNSPKTSDHLLALDLAEKAEEAFGDLPSSGARGEWAKGVHKQIELIYANAGLEFMRDLLIARKRADALGPQDSALLGFLAGQTHANGRELAELRADLHPALMTLVRGVNASSFEEQAHRAALENGLKLAVNMARELGSQKARSADRRNFRPEPQRQLPAPQDPAEAKARELGFPLLGRNDRAYENLNKFGANLTAQALAGELDPVIGREEETEQVIEILLNRKKGNPLIYGEAGVGKTAIVEGLAQRLVKGDVPERLKGKNIYSLDLNALTAGTTLRGQFEERLQKVLDEVENSKGKVILFIDEVHMIIGAGHAEGTSDMSNVIKKKMARPGFSMIGATTSDEFRKIEKDKALERRFRGVYTRPLSLDETTEVLARQKATLEEFHHITIADDAIKGAAKLAKRYVGHRKLPDSAIDLLGTAAAAAERRGERAVTLKDIAKLLERQTGNRVVVENDGQAPDSDRTREAIRKRVIGQRRAVDAVGDAIEASDWGHKNPNQPDSFIFLGPTGTGKTEIARAIAKERYGDEKALVKIDGSDYMEKHNVSRLNGAPPGYVGYDEGGQLTEPIRRRPNQVVLFDEIDKMHPDALNILLQILEDGEIKDSNGNVVDFRNTTIIMTANFLDSRGKDHRGDDGPKIGFRASFDKAKEAKPEEKAAEAYAAAKKAAAMAPAEVAAADALEAIEQARKQGALTQQYIDDLKGKLRPEFLNRVGEERTLVFNEFVRKDLRAIVELRLADLNAREADLHGLTLELTPLAKAFLVEYTWLNARAMGARPIKQTIDRQVDLAVLQGRKAGRVHRGDKVIVDYDPARGGWVADKAPTVAAN